MIAIVNVSKKFSAVGWQDYEVRINRDVIATFRHKREEGLAVCLREAMRAVERTQWEQIMSLLGPEKVDFTRRG